MSCELALVKLSVLSAWRFTQMLSAEASRITPASTIRSHGSQRCQPLVVTVAAVGLVTVHLLIRYVARRPLSVFVWYRIGFALLALAALGFS